jgi:transposase
VTTDLAAGLTVRDVARRYRVGEDKVRGWIKRGELSAMNTADRRCARPRFVVTAESLAEFERRRQAATPDAPKPRRRKRTNEIDFYPD